MRTLLWEPQVEGRNKNSTQFEIYVQDPFLAIVYVGSIPFFVALYKAIRTLGYVRTNQVLSTKVVNALRTFKYCEFAIIGFVVIEELWIMLLVNESDIDNPGAPILLGLLIVLPSIVVATVAAMLERNLQDAVDLKSDNDFTV